MNRAQLPRSLSYPIAIRRCNGSAEAMLAIAFYDPACVWTEFAAEILGQSETAYFSTLRFTRRQESYLLGRYAAKIALAEILSEPELRTIEIERGVFEQPVVRYDRKPRWDITISHAEGLAVAVAYPAEHPMGVDVERIESTRRETILSQLSEKEVGWVDASLTDALPLATALWTAKESLSKALRTGLMSPIKIYDLSEFMVIDSGIGEAFFENFAQYKARAWMGSLYALSIALPKRSALTLDYNLRAVL
jgi:4'-phosphopantetheinyl transferase